MRNFTAKSALSALAMTLSMSFAGAVSAQDEVTFHKDIEPILQPAVRTATVMAARARCLS